MSTLTAGPVSTSEDFDFLTVEPVTPARVLRSEWIKMRSLRSTALTLLAGIVSMVALGWIFGWANNANWSELNPDEQARSAPSTPLSPATTSHSSPSAFSACCWPPASTPPA